MIKLKSLIPKTLPTILFLSITIIQSIVDSIIIAILLNSFERNTTVLNSLIARDESSVLPVYLGLFILAHIFQFILAVDAIVMKNMIQILGLILFNTLFLIYSIIQILEINSSQSITGTNLKVIIWIIPGMIALTEIVYISTFWKINQEFGWQIYKKIGADRRLKRMFLWYQIFVCILKFDYFFFLSFSLQLVLLVLQQSRLERYLTAAAMPVTLILLLIGYFSVKKEIKSLCIIFLIGCILGAAYFVFKLFRIYQFRTTDYKLIYKSLTVFAALCLAALLWTVTCCYLCLKNFNNGLKWQMMKNTSETNLNNNSSSSNNNNNNKSSSNGGGGGYKMEESSDYNNVYGGQNKSYRMSMD